VRDGADGGAGVDSAAGMMQGFVAQGFSLRGLVLPPSSRSVFQRPWAQSACRAIFAQVNASRPN
jgi:hypothetical protein